MFIEIKINKLHAPQDIKKKITFFFHAPQDIYFHAPQGRYSSIGRATVCGTVGFLFESGYPPFLPG